MRVDPKFSRRQLALRRLFLKDGSLTADARIFLFLMKKACHARRVDRLLVRDDRGAVDPLATAAAAARRELYDEFVQTLNLDPYEITNLIREED